MGTLSSSSDLTDSDRRLVRLVRAAGVGRPEELGKPAGESHRTMSEEDPTLDQQLRSEEG